MTRSRYTALWSDDGGPPLAGLLEVGSPWLRFEGRNASRQASRRVRLDEIRSFSLERTPTARLLGRPAIALDVGGPEPIRISTPEPGALHELIDALTLTANP